MAIDTVDGEATVSSPNGNFFFVHARDWVWEGDFRDEDSGDDDGAQSATAASHSPSP